MRIVNAFLQFSIVICFATLMTSCATTSGVRSSFDESKSFSDYKSFDILDHSHGFPQGTNSSNMILIEKALIEELLGIGYVRSATPDLEVSWFVKIDEIPNKEYKAHYDKWENDEKMNVDRFRYGTLIVDIIDRSSNQIVWHGNTSRRIQEDTRDAEQLIDLTLKKMISRYMADIESN